MTMNVYVGVEGFKAKGINISILRKDHTAWVGLLPSSMKKAKPMVDGVCNDIWRFSIPIADRDKSTIEITIKQKVLTSEKEIANFSLSLNTLPVNDVENQWYDVLSRTDKSYQIKLRIHVDTEGAPIFHPTNTATGVTLQPQFSYPQQSNAVYSQAPVPPPGQQPQQQYAYPQYAYPQQTPNNNNNNQKRTSQPQVQQPNQAPRKNSQPQVQQPYSQQPQMYYPPQGAPTPYQQPQNVQYPPTYQPPLSNPNEYPSNPFETNNQYQAPYYPPPPM